jgi:hypothetical protein
MLKQSFVVKLFGAALIASSAACMLLPTKAFAAVFGDCQFYPILTATSLPLSDTMTTTYGGRAQCPQTASSIEIMMTVYEVDSKGISTQVASGDNTMMNTASYQWTATYNQPCALLQGITVYGVFSAYVTAPDGSVFGVSGLRSRPITHYCDAAA